MSCCPSASLIPSPTHEDEISDKAASMDMRCEGWLTGHLSHELACALQAGGSVGSAVGEVLLRLELLRALHIVPAAHQGLPLLLRCFGCPPLHLCRLQVNEVDIFDRHRSTPSACQWSLRGIHRTSLMSGLRNKMHLQIRLAQSSLKFLIAAFVLCDHCYDYISLLDPGGMKHRFCACRLRHYSCGREPFCQR